MPSPRPIRSQPIRPPSSTEPSRADPECERPADRRRSDPVEEQRRPLRRRPRTSSGESAANDMRNLPLGTLLYRHGLVGQEELEEALTTGMATGERLGEILIARGRVSEDDIARLLAVQQGLPFLHEDEVSFDHEAAGLLPLDEARAWGAAGRVRGRRRSSSPPRAPRPASPTGCSSALHRDVSAVVVTDSVFEALLARASAPAADARPETQTDEAAEPAADDRRSRGSRRHPPTSGRPKHPSPRTLSRAPGTQSHAGEPSFSGSGDFEPVESEVSEPVDLDRQLLDEQAVGEQPVEEQLEAWQGAGAEADDHQPAELEADGFAPSDASSEEPEPHDVFCFAPDERGRAGRAGVPRGAVGQRRRRSSPSRSRALERARGRASRSTGASPQIPSRSIWASPSPSRSDDDPARRPSAPVIVEDGRIHELGAQHEASVGRIHDLLGQIEAGASTFSDLRRRLGEPRREPARRRRRRLAEREQRLAELRHAHEDDQRRIEELVGQLREREDTLGELGGRVEELSGRLVSAEERLDERERGSRSSTRRSTRALPGSRSSSARWSCATRRSRASPTSSTRWPVSSATTSRGRRLRARGRAPRAPPRPRQEARRRGENESDVDDEPARERSSGSRAAGRSGRGLRERLCARCSAAAASAADELSSWPRRFAARARRSRRRWRSCGGASRMPRACRAEVDRTLREAGEALDERDSRLAALGGRARRASGSGSRSARPRVGRGGARSSAPRRRGGRVRRGRPGAGARSRRRRRRPSSRPARRT